MTKAEPNTPLQKLCDLLGLPVSSYYYTPVLRAEEQAIKQTLRQIFEENLRAYGKRRISKALKNAGFDVGVFKASRLMKELELVAKRPKKPHYYTAGKELPDIPNLLNREFIQPTLGTHWVGDITYSVLGVYF